MSAKEYDVGNGYTYKHSVIRTGSGGRDVWMVKSVTQNVVNVIEKTYVPRNDDVFLCTFIKSGTTWVQAILRELIDIAEGTDTRVEGVSVGLTEGERIPWIEEMAAIAGPTIYTKRLNEQSPKRRRVFKTHLPYPVVQNWATKGTKFIFVVRDPRDVAVSAWHHTRTKNFTYKGPFEHFANEMFLKGRVECGNWFEFTKECYDAVASASDNCLLLRYENMLKDPATAVREVAKFLDVKVNEENVKQVVNNTSFDAMRKAEKKGGLRVPGWPKRKLQGADGDGDVTKPSKMHIRSGGSRKWKSYFDSALERKFLEAYKKHLEKKCSFVLDA
eukprot:g1333.t1